jgi:hypothetical protein
MSSEKTQTVRIISILRAHRIDIIQDRPEDKPEALEPHATNHPTPTCCDFRRAQKGVQPATMAHASLHDADEAIGLGWLQSRSRLTRHVTARQQDRNRGVGPGIRQKGSAVGGVPTRRSTPSATPHR